MGSPGEPWKLGVYGYIVDESGEDHIAEDDEDAIVIAGEPPYICGE